MTPRTTFLLVVCLAWPATASADLIRPRPLKCPPGTYKYTNHCGSVCKERRCKADKDCKGKLRCLSNRLCVFKGLRRACGRAGAFHKGKKFPYSKVTGQCEGGDKCKKGGRCVETKRCLPAPVQKDPPAKEEPKAKEEPPAKEEPKAKEEPPVKEEPKAKAEPPAEETPDEEDSEDQTPPDEPKPTKPSGCAVGSSGVGAGWLVLLLVLVGSRRRG